MVTRTDDGRARVELFGVGDEGAVAGSEPERVAPRQMYAVLAAVLVTGAVFFCVTSRYFDPFTPVAPDAQQHFYEGQARALLGGRLDVPADAIGDEAIVVAGRDYGYYGIAPALLRLPIMVFAP